MAKRFTDTEIWEQDWFLALPRDYRDLWLYIKDSCDHAGIWRPNVITFNKVYDCQCKLDVGLKLFNEDREENDPRIIVLPKGRWFLTGFIPFQYGKILNLDSRAHASVYALLTYYEVKLTSIRPNIEVKHRVKDKDKDKDKDKELKAFKDSGFKPPTLSEVTAYCLERKNTVNPQSFIDHYQANGWIRGKTKIKDWKACVRTWESKEPLKKPSKPAQRQNKPECLKCKGTGFIHDENGVFRGKCSCNEV